jgi:GNAT superfamily N-acetyltransferase
MEVRKADPADAPAVSHLIGRFFTEEGFTTPPEEVTARMPDFLSTPGNAAFLALDGDGAVGVSTVTSTFGLEFGRVGEIEDLYVLPARRGQGVATPCSDRPCSGRVTKASRPSRSW